MRSGQWACWWGRETRRTDELGCWETEHGKLIRDYLNNELIISIVEQCGFVDMKVKVEWKNGYGTSIEDFECLIRKYDSMIKV